MVRTRHQTSGVGVLPNNLLWNLRKRQQRRTVPVLHSESELEAGVIPGYDTDESGYTAPLKKRRRKLSSSPPAEINYAESSGSKQQTTRHSQQRQHRGSDCEIHKSKEIETSADSFGHSYDTRFMNVDLDGETGVRRSTRQKKLLYDNLNQKWLLTSGIPELTKLDALFSSDRREENPMTKSKNGVVRRSYELRRLGLTSASVEFEDMYSRVKRQREKANHRLYQNEQHEIANMADTEDTDQQDEENEDGSESEGGDYQDDDISQPQKYYLRKKKPVTDRFQFPIDPVRSKKAPSSNIFHTPNHHHLTRDHATFKSPAHRSPYKRRHHATHNSSSTSSSSDDERRFERRKARSMARARNRCLPMNFAEEDLSKGVLRDRAKIGTSLADIDPMEVDKSVFFESIGGLDSHIQALKEMVLFPLMYSEVFEKFKISPPRGVLFHGPPGTGKTLLARALANECSQGDKRVGFFMRKGADCLSKWVGESERQLRLLFDQAYSMRPSIIFFDEIDGLAPVRSTRQDQIHSSIVSTLLALMDGLDNRGEIVVIGATNRIDSIDPALRRPGRFDREFHFGLPSLEARQTILRIHTKHWQPILSDSLLEELAVRTVGYCGADLKALCTEATLLALRRCYPQIYKSRQKLQLDLNTIKIERWDFEKAMTKIVPATQRSSPSPARSLKLSLRPLLQRFLEKGIKSLKVVFPAGLGKALTPSNSTTKKKSELVLSEEDESTYSDDEELLSQELSSVPTDVEKRIARGIQCRFGPPSHRPRLLLAGEKDQGQTSHLGPAILHCLEHLPVHKLDLPTLHAVSSRSPEEACTEFFHEAQQTLPSVLYLPHLDQWWSTSSDILRATFTTLLSDTDPSIPLFLLTTSDCPLKDLPVEVQHLFSVGQGEVLQMENPNRSERYEYFSKPLLRDAKKPPKKKKTKNMEITLPVAPPPEPRKLTNVELRKLVEQEEATLRELRLFLREILNKLARDRRFAMFTKPVDPEEVPDYHHVISNPMDLETMMTKIDLHCYQSVSQFLDDIDLICHNALEYNPDRDPSDKLIRHRACALKDTAHALIDTELDEEFEKICEGILESRKQRGDTPSKYAPKNYKVLPLPRPETQTNTTNPKTGVKEENEASQSLVEAPQRTSALEVTPTSSDPEVASKERKPVNQNSTRSKFVIVHHRKPGLWFGCRRRTIRRVPGTTPRKVDVDRTLKITPISNRSETKEVKVNSKLPSGDEEKNSVSNHFHGDQTESSGLGSELTGCSSGTNHSSTSNTCIASEESSNLSIDDGLHTGKGNCDNKDSSDVRDVDKSEQQDEIELISVVSSDRNKYIVQEHNLSSMCFEGTKASEPEEVVVDNTKLERLLQQVVDITEGSSLETLERLYFNLDHCIYRHRKAWNKTDLVKDLESTLDQFQQLNCTGQPVLAR